MKNQVLITFGILLASITSAQEKFFTNNFAKEVTELNTSLKTVEFTTVLPSDFKKYDDIVAVIDTKDEGGNDYYQLNFYYNIRPVTEVPANRKMSYVVETGTDKRNDFTSVFRQDVDVDFELFHSVNYEARAYRYQTVAVKVMGRNQDGMHWVNEKYVPKYNYSEISFSEIKLDLGAPKPTFTSENGLFTIKKYTSGKSLPKIVSDEETDNLSVIYEYGDEDQSKTTFSIYEIKAGEVQQESFDMSGGAPEASTGTSVQDMIKEVKLNLKKSLIKSSCFNEARSVKLEGQRFGDTKVMEGIYEPYMLDAEGSTAGSGKKALGSLKSIGSQFGGQGGGNDKYNKFIESSESDLNWKETKLGNASFEVLELDFYDYGQCESSSSNKTMTVKENQKGKTQRIVLFLGEVDGRLFLGTFSKDGEKEMTAEDLKFKEFMFSNFQVNN